MRIYFYLCVSAWLLSATLAAEPIAIDDVNTVRKAAGLSLLNTSAALDRSADAHAQYLVHHRPLLAKSTISAHQQLVGSSGYTGGLAPERAQYFGYEHSQVLENISLGNESVSQSVADLMTAIYHRFTFLDFAVDEMGAGNLERRYVYNLGKRSISQACLNQPAEAGLDKPYLCQDTLMTHAAYRSMCANVPVEAIFSKPFPGRCENGALLDAKFMRKVCEVVPKEALLKGAGSYIDLCQNGTRIDVKWYRRLCGSKNESIIYPHSGRAYSLCQPPVMVHADWYEGICGNLPKVMQYTDSGRYYQACSNGFKIKSEYFKQLETARLATQPEVVIWPPDGATNITPVFYDEDPHPTPDLPLTGYPISIQFNTAKVREISIINFTLEQYIQGKQAHWQRVDDIRRIDQHKDVNQYFSAQQFAWFPLHRLNWNRFYRYTIIALVDGIEKQYSAGFSTSTLNAPLYALPEPYLEISVNEKHFILYRKPSRQDALPFREVRFEYKNNSAVVANVIDSSTLELKIMGNGCAPILVHTRIGEQIRIHHCPKSKWRS